MKKDKLPRSLAIAEAGITGSASLRDFANAAIADVLAGRIDTPKANSAKGFGWLSLRTAEIEYRLSAKIANGVPRKMIELAGVKATKPGQEL